MSRSLTPFQTLMLGAIILAALALSGTGLFAVGSGHWPWNDNFTIRAGFQHIGGVEVGTRVRIQGVDAGEVVEIQPPAEPDGKVVLTLRLAPGWRERGLLRTDACAEIGDEGFVGVKFIEINPGHSSERLAENALIASRKSPDMKDVLKQVDSLKQTLDQISSVVKTVEEEKGKVHEVVENTNKLVEQSNKTMASIQKSADAVQRLPVVRSYVEDARELLYRPQSNHTEYWFGGTDLFDPGRAQLTSQGMKHLDSVAGRLASLTREKGAELVIVAYTDPKQQTDPDRARTLTQQQSKAVLDYLSSHHGIYKKWYLFAAKSRSLGLGLDSAALPDSARTRAGDVARNGSGAVGTFVFVPSK